MAQICNHWQLSFLLSGVVKLDILRDGFFQTLNGIDLDNIQWLGFLQPFTAVRILRVSDRLHPFIASALQLTYGTATEVLVSDSLM